MPHSATLPPSNRLAGQRTAHRAVLPADRLRGNPPSAASWSIDARLILLALVVGFCDESVRKALPGTPIMVTCLKDVLLAVAGVRAILADGIVRKVVKIFVPWAAYVCLSECVVLWNGGGLVHAVSVVRTYLGPVWLFALGMRIARERRLLDATKRIFFIGCVLSVTVAILQEVARDMLPEFLSARVYIEGHSEAGGKYNEAIFASPAVLAHCLLVGAMGMLVEVYASSKRDVLGYLLLLYFAVGIYLTRIRTGLVLGSVGLCLVWLLVLRARWMRREVVVLRTAVFGALAVAAILFFQILGSFDAWKQASGVNLEQESSFYENLTNPSALWGRLLWVYEELALNDMSLGDAILGYGAGTAGPLHSFLATPDWDVPRAYDTGMFMLLSEFGVVGLAVFLLLCCLMLSRMFRATVSGRFPKDAVWSSVVALLFCVSFLFKGFYCMANGFVEMLWFSSAGISCGLLVSSGRAARMGGCCDGVHPSLRHSSAKPGDLS